jgi:hypothetical protein
MFGVKSVAEQFQGKFDNINTFSEVEGVWELLKTIWRLEQKDKDPLGTYIV